MRRNAKVYNRCGINQASVSCETDNMMDVIDMCSQRRVIESINAKQIPNAIRDKPSETKKALHDYVMKLRWVSPLYKAIGPADRKKRDDFTRWLCGRNSIDGEPMWNTSLIGNWIRYG